MEFLSKADSDPEELTKTAQTRVVIGIITKERFFEEEKNVLETKSVHHIPS